MRKELWWANVHHSVLSMNIVLGFVGGKEDLVDKVKAGLEAENLKIDEIIQKFSKREIESFLGENKGKYQVLIINEYLEPDNPYREREIERLSATLENMTIVLIVKKERYGSEYMQRLYNNGFYNVLFSTDSSMKNIATIIKGGRSRRIAMAYYGLSSVETQEPVKTDAMTIGMAIDMINALKSMDEKIAFLKKALIELGEIQFVQFVKHLHSDIHAVASEDDVLCEYFSKEEKKKTMTAEDVPVDFREIKNDVLAVIDESENGARSAKFSYALSLGIATTTKLKPSFVQLPYKADAFDVLNFTEDFKKGFLSHLQAVKNGLPFPTAHNDSEGVNIVCTNPATDILDDWNVLQSYKVMFQVDHPAVLDVGNSFANDDIKDILTDVSLWIVIVPPDVPVGAYLTELKGKIGKNVEHPIIAITNRDSGIVVSEKFTEFGFPMLYTDEFNYPINCRNEMHELISLTPYGEGMNKDAAVNIKKKVVKETKFVPEKIQGLREISLAGSGHGSGCTYSVMAIAGVLAKYYRVAVVECNESGDFDCMSANTKNKKFKVGNINMFSFKGVDFFYNCTQAHFRSTFKEEYDFVIYDCGLDVAKDEFTSADYKIVSVSGALWRMDEVDLLARTLDIFDHKRKVVCLVSGRRTCDISSYRVLCHKRNFYGVPLEYDAFSQGVDFVNIVSRIVGITLK